MRDIQAVRQELAAAAVGDPLVELATIVRMGGTWHRRGSASGSTTTVVVSSSVGAVVRRVSMLAARLDLPRPGLEMRERGGVRATTTWGARLDAACLVPLGVATASGAPHGHLPAWGPDPGAALRACLMVATSLSTPQHRPHVEVRPPSARLVDDVRALFAHFDVGLTHDPVRGRLVGKSGADIVVVLDAAGATRAAAEHAEQRQRRRLRNTVVRLTNADEANLARAVRAAGTQVDDLVRLRDAAGWETVPDHLREVALARLANPTATMAELGQLCDPPVGKSTVHRRMAALRRLAAEAASDPEAPSGPEAASGPEDASGPDAGA